MKKIITSLALAAALLAPMAASAAALEYTIDPIGTTYIQAGTNASEVLYDNNVGLCNQSTISNGVFTDKLEQYGGSTITLTKINLATIGKNNVTKAALHFDAVCTVASKNSNIGLAQVNGTGWNPKTATWAETNTKEVLDAKVIYDANSAGINSNSNGGSYSFDVTEQVKEAMKIGYIGFGFYTYTGREQKISNVKLIVEAIDASTSAEITLDYVCNGQSLKTEKKVVNVGECYVMEDADKAPIYVDGVKYVYESDNAATKPGVAGTATTVTVVYVEAQKYVYSVNYVAGEDVIGTVTGLSNWENENVYQPFPQYINVKGTLYAKDAINKEYRFPFVLDEFNKVVNIDGYKETSTNGVIYYTEAEDLPGVTVINSGNALVRSSNAASAQITEDTKVVTLPAGSYKLYMVLYNSTKSDMTAVVMAGETELASFTSNNSNYDAKSKEFVLEEAADIILQPVGSGKAGIDLLYIVDQNATQGISAVAAPAKDGKIYNLQGVEVQNPQKGIYIQNGKKFIVR